LWLCCWPLAVVKAAFFLLADGEAGASPAPRARRGLAGISRYSPSRANRATLINTVMLADATPS